MLRVAANLTSGRCPVHDALEIAFLWRATKKKAMN
jgi:hypothetical protein